MEKSLADQSPQEMIDEYVCNDCGQRWYGEEMDCPSCKSTNTGLDVPDEEEMH